MSPKTFANPIYAETNAFWDLKLEDSPEAITSFARSVADEAQQRARAEMLRQEVSAPSYQRLDGLLERAAREYELGQRFEAAAKTAHESAAIYDWSRATRAYTRAQVRARQVLNALVPPAASSEDLEKVERVSKSSHE
jgi:hypothetical protein